MKKISIMICALSAGAAIAFGGTSTYSGKESKDVKQVAQQAPCPEWYRDQEFNVDLWGTYAFTGNSYLDDRYLGVDHAWGGGLDLKYFFHRYFGVGVEGYVVSLNENNGVVFQGGRLGTDSGRSGLAGAGLGTFTFRYPIPCSRFAPYVFAGGGAIFGGGGRTDVFFNGNTFVARQEDSQTKGIGQFGAGIEVRMTPHIGIMSDFSWNVVDGSDNNFGMVRTGLTFAF